MSTGNPFNARYDGGGEFRVDVQAAGENTWANNALTFDDREDADAYALDLALRWTAVKNWRVVPVSTPTREAVAT